jgi:hypothetical protein
VKNQSLVDDLVISSPRCPVEMRVTECIKKQHPILISSVQRKERNGKTALLSHHFFYGSKWRDSSMNDDSFTAELAETLPRKLSTVRQARTNILVQAVGLKDEQHLDRPTDSSFYAYIKDIVNDREEDNLLTQMIKQSPTGLRFALHYTYTP